MFLFFVRRITMRLHKERDNARRGKGRQEGRRKNRCVGMYVCERGRESEQERQDGPSN